VRLCRPSLPKTLKTITTFHGASYLIPWRKLARGLINSSAPPNYFSEDSSIAFIMSKADPTVSEEQFYEEQASRSSS
jgi:hypothetical protein